MPKNPARAASAIARFEFKFHVQPGRWSEEYTTTLYRCQSSKLCKS